MAFKSQEPVFVQRARQVASLHMAYHLKYSRYGRPGNGFWAFGAQPQPLSVQSPRPSVQDWYGQRIKAVCVTLRYSDHWQVRVHLQCTEDGRECRQWKILRLESIFPGDRSTPKSALIVLEGQQLYDALVKSYCMRIEDLACSFFKDGDNDDHNPFSYVEEKWYRMANGDMVKDIQVYDVVKGESRRRIPMPAYLFSLPIYEEN